MKGTKAIRRSRARQRCHEARNESRNSAIMQQSCNQALSDNFIGLLILNVTSLFLRLKSLRISYESLMASSSSSKYSRLQVALSQTSKGPLNSSPVHGPVLI